MEKVLVTGSAGFIGSNLVEDLLDLGYDVLGIDSFNDYYSPKIKRQNNLEVEEKAKTSKGSFTLFEGDIRDEDFLNEIFEKHKINVVVHLAAYAGVRPSIKNPNLYYSVNVMGTLNILNAMQKHSVKRLVFASSSSVYGNNKSVPFKETDNVDRAISPYASSKKAGEVMCYTFHHLYGISMAVLRFFTVYGKRQRPDLAIHKFTKLIDEGKPIPFFGDGSMKRDHSYIADILQGVKNSIVWTKEKDGYEIFNIGESTPVSLSSLVEMIGKAVGKEPIIERLPVPPGDVKITYADVSKAEKMLGYKPTTPLEKGLKEFTSWYFSHKDKE